MEKKTKESVSKSEKILAKIKALISDAQAQERKLVVFTTKKKHYKTDTDGVGFGVEDLKKKYRKVYDVLNNEYTLSSNLLSMEDKSVEWIVTLK